MSNFRFLDLYRNYPVTFLTVLLSISLSSALFMPAMFTFSYGLPSLILLFYAYIAMREKSIQMFLILTIGSALSVIILIGFLVYLIFFTIFINIFPTFIVLLITLLLIQLIPRKITLLYKIILFFFISTLFGFNTKINDLIKPSYKIEEKINEVLTLNDSDIVKIIGNKLEYPSSYNPFSFITFGSNEGCGCGYWEYPRVDTEYFVKHLQTREISYSTKNNSPYTITINSFQNHDKYTVDIQMKSNSKLISSLKIIDKLPYQSSNNTKALDAFDQRLEYLLRHNIWNSLLYFSTIPSNTDNSKVINDFLDKSIKYHTKHSDWRKNTYFIEGKLIKKVEKEDCSINESNDFKYYAFNIWQDTSSDKSAKITSNNIFTFDSNNTTYSTKILSKYSENIQAYNETLWNDNAFSYSDENAIYTFYTFRVAKNIRIIQFTKTGQFVKELYVSPPKDIVLEGSDWHPISHVEVVDSKMRFRVYNIYESKTNSEAAAPIKDQCSFNELEIQLP